MLGNSGKTTALMSLAHVLSWAQKDISGPIIVATEDWEGFARAIRGIRTIQLDTIASIAWREENRFVLNDYGNQAEFWKNLRKAVQKSIKGN